MGKRQVTRKKEGAAGRVNSISRHTKTGAVEGRWQKAVAGKKLD